MKEEKEKCQRKGKNRSQIWRERKKTEKREKVGAYARGKSQRILCILSRAIFFACSFPSKSLLQNSNSRSHFLRNIASPSYSPLSLSELVRFTNGSICFWAHFISLIYLSAHLFIGFGVYKMMLKYLLAYIPIYSLQASLSSSHGHSSML